MAVGGASEMEIRKSALAIIFSVLIPLSVAGQSTPKHPPATDDGKTDGPLQKKALEKKALALIDETLKEIALLRLPENRIRLKAEAADMLWKYDEKRAR